MLERTPMDYGTQDQTQLASKVAEVVARNLERMIQTASEFFGRPSHAAGHR